MSARPIPPGNYSPPPPELRDVFGSFTQLWALIRAGRNSHVIGLPDAGETVDPRRACEDLVTHDETADRSAADD